MGKVALDRSDLAIDHLRHDWGVGLYADWWKGSGAYLPGFWNAGRHAVASEDGEFVLGQENSAFGGTEW